MWQFLVRRVLIVSPLAILGVLTITFLMIHLIPGDPVRMMYGRTTIVSQEIMDNVRRQLGLDQPIPVQYARYMSRVMSGDLGRSVRSHRPVADEILARAPSTFQLAAAALLISIMIGAPIGLLSALQRGKLFDKLGMILALVGVSLPPFWFGLVLMYVFAVRLNWFPVIGQGMGRGLVLPAITLGIGEAATIARLFRSSMLDVLGQLYLVTARAKGLPERWVILKHALRNALIPVLTIIGMAMGYLLAGSVIIEVVFGRPGLGNMAVQGILDRDFPMVQGVVLFTAVVFVTSNTLVDVLYAALDPRIRYQ